MHCERTSLGFELGPELIAALRAKGKTDKDIARLEADGYKQLEALTPARLSCTFLYDELLSAALDLAEGQHEPKPWQQRCKEAKDSARR